MVYFYFYFIFLNTFNGTLVCKNYVIKFVIFLISHLKKFCWGILKIKSHLTGVKG